MTDKTVLSLHDIHKHYDIEGHRLDVLKGVDFVLNQGDKVALTGKSGAGKSTLMNIIATIEYPDKGSVEIDGKHRRLVPIELERLFGFPDDHTLGVTDSKRAFLMGNALLVGVVELFAEVFLSEI